MKTTIKKAAPNQGLTGSKSFLKPHNYQLFILQMNKKPVVFKQQNT